MTTASTTATATDTATHVLAVNDQLSCLFTTTIRRFAPGIRLARIRFLVGEEGGWCPSSLPLALSRLRQTYTSLVETQSKPGQGDLKPEAPAGPSTLNVGELKVNPLINTRAAGLDGAFERAVIASG